eukprot:scaffold211317_cov34-Tisochrysis_lutea.AAC.3
MGERDPSLYPPPRPARWSLCRSYLAHTPPPTHASFAPRAAQAAPAHPVQNVLTHSPHPPSPCHHAAGWEQAAVGWREIPRGMSVRKIWFDLSVRTRSTKRSH